MKELFKNYLIKEGYAEYTPKGLPSTVYDYIKRIDFVCENEKMTWIQLSEHIHQIITDYDINGKKEHLGNKSHRAVINALKRYKEFLER